MLLVYNLVNHSTILLIKISIYTCIGKIILGKEREEISWGKKPPKGALYSGH